MPKPVKGFLASDGKFFDTDAECQRYEFSQTLKALCDSHGINADNFFVLLHEWHETIQGYYNADAKCKTKAVVRTGTVSFANDLSQDQVDNEDHIVGDKDAPAFLEQQIRRHK